MDPFNGQVSSRVMLPLKLKVKSSNRGSDDGLDVALMDLWILQVLPMTLISLLNILVFFEMTASLEMRM